MKRRGNKERRLFLIIRGGKRVGFGKRGNRFSK
jgi:hypothetical protein